MVEPKCKAHTCYISQGKGTLFRNIQNTGRWHYFAYVLVGSYVLIHNDEKWLKKHVFISFETL